MPDPVQWEESVEKDELTQVVEEVINQLTDHRSEVRERFLSYFGIKPEDLNTNSEEVFDAFKERFLKTPEDWQDREIWESLYILGVLTGWVLSRKRHQNP